MSRRRTQRTPITTIPTIRTTVGGASPSAWDLVSHTSMAASTLRSMALTATRGTVALVVTATVRGSTRGAITGHGDIATRTCRIAITRAVRFTHLATSDVR